MTVKEAVDWLTSFGNPNDLLTVDVYFPGDEFPHNKVLMTFRNEIIEDQKKVVMRYHD